MKKGKIIALIILAIVFSVVFVYFFFLNRNSSSSETDLNVKNLTNIEEDLNSTLSSLISGEVNEENIFLLYNDEARQFPIANGDTARKILSCIDYKINDFEIEGELATSTLSISAPDLQTILLKIQQNEEFSTVDEVLNHINSVVNQDYEKKIFEVSVQLTLLEEHWYLTPSFDFYNAISGGLLQAFIDNEYKTYESIKGGAE